MAQVGNVIFSISADLKNVQGQLRTLEGNFDRSFSGITAKARNFGRSFAGALGIGLGITALIGFGKEVVNTVGQLNDLADQTGLSAQTLSGLRVEVRDAGVEIAQFAKGILFAQKSLGDMEGLGKEVAEALTAIGLSAREMASATPDEFLQRVAEGLSKIPNQIDRVAVATKIFGRSGAELANALAKIAPNFAALKASGLDNSTIKAMDDLATSIDRLKNAVINFAAAPIAGLFNFLRFLTGASTESEKTAQELSALADRSIRVAQQLRASQQLRAEGVRSGIASDRIYNELIAQRNDLLEKTDVLNKRLSGQTEPAKGGKFQNLLGGASETAAKKEQTNAVNKFLESLEKESAKLQINIKEQQLGAAAAKEYALGLEFAAAKADALANKQGVPAGAEERFRRMVAEIMDLSRAFDAAQMAAGRMADEIARSSRDSEAWATYEQEVNDLQRAAADEFARIEAEITADLQTEAERRIAIVNEEYEARLRAIEANKNATGASEEWKTEMIIKAEQARALKIAEINTEVVDEVTKFQERAWERMHDAMSDTFRDFMAGNIKSWQDLGNRIKRVIDDIVSEWLAMQLKIAILGPDYGKKGGGVGGLLGLIGGLFGIGGKGGGGPAAPDIDLIPDWYAKGGVVKGLPSFRGGGEVPIMAHAGEYVLNRRATANISTAMLDGINMAGRLPGMGQKGNGVTFAKGAIQVNATDAGSFVRASGQVQAAMSKAATRARNRNFV